MKQKWAVVKVPIFRPKSATSTSLLSITKLTLPLIVTIIFPTFLLIKEINDNNNASMNMKDPQKQEEKTLNLKAHILIAYTRSPVI